MRSSHHDLIETGEFPEMEPNELEEIEEDDLPEADTSEPLPIDRRQSLHAALQYVEELQDELTQPAHCNST